jgi:hypothetical protein
LIVARTVMTDVPEPVGPWPIALTAKLSLPLYLDFAVYSYVDMLSFFNLPCAGFCEMSELLTVPRSLIGSWQLPPDATSMSPVEFSPQSASVTDIEQSEAARAKDTGVKPAVPATSARAATLDNRMVDLLAFTQTLTMASSGRRDGSCALRPEFLNFWHRLVGR